MVNDGSLAVADYSEINGILAKQFESMYVAAVYGGRYFNAFADSLQLAVSNKASEAITYYFDNIRESVALNKAGEEAGAGLSVAVQGMNRLSNISQTFGYLADKVQPFGHPMTIKLKIKA